MKYYWRSIAGLLEYCGTTGGVPAGRGVSITGMPAFTSKLCYGITFMNSSFF